jgi:membrane-anchored protein YejM (alkaline phosphatase superfamily)
LQCISPVVARSVGAGMSALPPLSEAEPTYAGALAHCDHQINRFLDALEATGRMDNTLIIYIMSDTRSRHRPV